MQNQNWLIKRYRIFIHKLNIQSPINIKTISLTAARATQISATLTYQINQEVQLCAIGKARNPNQISQSEAFIILNGIYQGQQKILGTLGFDFKTQKPGSRTSQLRHKQLIEGNGSVSYKLLGSQYMQIDMQSVQQQKLMRQQILIEKKSYQKAQREAQYAQMVRLVEQKDQIIKNLQEKMSSLLRQTRTLHQNLSKQKQKVKKNSLEKPIKTQNQRQPFSINVNVQSNAHQSQVKKLSSENQKLKLQIHQLQIKIQGLQDHIDDVQSQLSQKRSTFNHDFNSKQKFPKKMTQSRYQDQKSAILIHREGMKDGTVSQTKLKGLKRAESSSIMNEKLYEDDWQKRRQRRRDQRRKQRAQQQQIQNQYAKRQQQAQERLKKQQQKTRQRRKTILQRGIKTQESQLMNKTLIMQGSAGDLMSRGDQHKLRLLVHKLEQQKMMSQQKLYAKKDEAQSIYRQLQRAKNRQKKLQEELQSFRSMVNYYKSHGISLGQISENQKIYLQNLAKRNALGALGQTDLPQLKGRQRQTMIEQKLRFEIVQLKDQLQIIKNKYRVELQEKDMQILKRKMVQESEKKEKQVYIAKYRQLNEQFQIQRLNFKDALDKAQQLDPALNKVRDLQNQGVELANKLSKQTKQKSDLATKVKRFTQMMEDRQIQFQRLKNLQSNYQVLKIKNANMQKANQKFSENYKQLKRFALKAQQMIGKKPKKTNKSDGKTQQQYQKQLIKILDQLQNKIKNQQKTYFQQHIKTLTEQRQLYKALFDKRLQQQKNRIKDTLSSQKATNAAQERQLQIKNMKQDRVRQVQSKINKFQKLLDIIASKRAPSDLTERVQQLKLKIQSDNLTNNESVKQMRQTISRLMRQIKVKQDQLIFLKKNSAMGLIGSNTDDRMKARTSMMQDFLKTKEMLSKPFEDIKKINHQLMKSKNALQIQAQNGKIRQQQLNMKLRQKQKEAQRAIKKIEQQNQKKFDQNARVQTRLTQQLNKVKADNKDLQTSVKDLVEQLKSISQALQNKQIAFNKIQGLNQRLNQNLVQYQQAEKKLIQDVQRVKKDSANNQAQFERLFLQRDDKFLKIQKLKLVQIQKLKDELARCEQKLQKQVLDGLQLRQQNDKYAQAMASYDQQIKEIKQAQRIMDQNHRKYVQQTKLQIQAYEQQNDTLKQNLLGLAQQINEKQLQIQQFKVKMQYNKKRVESLQKINEQYKSGDEQSYLQKLQSQKLIQDQTLQIKKLQNNMEIIKSKITMLAQQNDHYQQINIQLKQQINQLKNKLRNNQDSLAQSNRDKLHLDALIQQAQHKQIQYQKKEKQFIKKINHLDQQINSLQYQKIDNQAKIKQLQLQLYQEKKNKSKEKQRRGSHGKQSSIIKQNSSIHLGQAKSTLRKSVSRISSHSINEDEKSRTGSIVKKPSRMMKRQNIIIPDDQGSNQYIQQKSSSKILNKSSKISRQSSQPQSKGFMKNSSKISKQEEYFQSKRISNKSKVQINPILDSLKKDSNSLIKLQNSKRVQQGLASSNRMQLQDIKEEQQQNSNLLHSSQRDGKLKFQRKGSNIEIEVSQCESQPIDQQLQKPMNDSDIMLSKNSLQLQNQEQFEQQQVQEENRYQVAQLLDQIDLLNEQKEGLLDKIQQQQQDIQGLKAQLMTWKRSAIDKKSSMNEISHGFTSQLNQKLRVQDQDFDQDHSGANKRPSFDAFSRSAVVDKISSKVQLKRSQSKMDVYGSSGDDRTNKILLDEAEQNIKQLQRQLQEQRNNVEKMIQVNKQMQEEADHAQQKIKALQNQKIQMIQQIQSTKNEMETKNQEMMADILSKQQHISELNQQIGELKKQIQNKNIQLLDLSTKLKNSQEQIENKNKALKNMKKQFRKYEQQSELEILKLKENLSKFKQQVKLKGQDMTTIGDKYIQLQQKHNVLLIQIRHKDQMLQGKQLQGNNMLKKYYQTVNLLKQQQFIKNDYQKEVNRLKTTLQQKQQDIQIMGKQSALTIKKYCIKIQALEQQLKSNKKKLQDRDDHISRLKHQVMLYNQSIQQVTKSKQSLSTQLQRVETQLKDIMHSYQGQFQDLNQSRKVTQSQVQQYSGMCLQKDQELMILNKQLAQKNRQIKELTSRLDENNKNLERFKIKARNQLNDVHTQLQLKNDQFQKLKTQSQRQNQAFFSKECQFIQQKEKSDSKIKQYKQRFLQYEQQINEFSQQLMDYSNRPSLQQWQQINFQNELYRNRISELQSNLRQQQQNSQQQLIYAEFRKYKINKQRQIQDLQMEMQRYGNKVNQLEQSNFYQKKDNQGIKHQLKIANNEKQKLQTMLQQLEEQNQQMKMQLDLIKAKRQEDMGRALDLSIS